MISDTYHDFFVAAASAAGALIGLLFVAMSVWNGREEERRVVEFHRLRATAALTVFSNALTISLFALIPGQNLGLIAWILAAAGIVFVVASGLRLLRLLREHVPVRVRDVLFLVGGAALFIAQLLAGFSLASRPHDVSRVQPVADLVIYSLLFGIARSWELIGGPQIGVAREVLDLLHPPTARADPAPTAAPADPADPAAGDGSPSAAAPGD